MRLQECYCIVGSSGLVELGDHPMKIFLDLAALCMLQTVVE